MSTAEAIIPQWTIGDRILRARKHAELEQVELAQELGISRSLVSMWERDLGEPRVGQIKKLAEVTGVSEQWLLGFGSTSMYESTPSLTLLLGGQPDQLNLFRK